MSRPTAEHLLIDRAVQQRPVKTADGKGGFSDTFPTLRSRVKARVNVAIYKEIRQGEQEKAKVDHVIYLVAGSDVLLNDRFVVNGRTYRVTVPAMNPSLPVYHKTGLEEIQGG